MSWLDEPGTDWPKPIELNATLPIVLEQLAFLGDTRSRRELLVFAQANPARLPLAMGMLQPDIPVRRMANERKTKLTDALVRILRRFLKSCSYAKKTLAPAPSLTCSYGSTPVGGAWQGA